MDFTLGQRAVLDDRAEGEAYAGSYDRSESSPSVTYAKDVAELVASKVPYRGTKEFVRVMILRHSAQNWPMRDLESRFGRIVGENDTSVEARWALFVESELSGSHGYSAWLHQAKVPDAEIMHLELQVQDPEPILDPAPITDQSDKHETSGSDAEAVHSGAAQSGAAFKASEALVQHWIRGVNSNLEEANQPTVDLLSAAKNQTYAAELEKQIRTIINNFAKRKAYEGGRYRISFGGRLYPSIETLLVDHLMLPPRNAVDFLDELRALLFDQSKERPVFYGRWGKLIVDDANELVLDLVKRKSRKLSKVLKA